LQKTWEKIKWENSATIEKVEGRNYRGKDIKL
jgi:hypothetical protein